MVGSNEVMNPNQHHSSGVVANKKGLRRGEVHGLAILAWQRLLGDGVGLRSGGFQLGDGGGTELGEGCGADGFLRLPG